MANKLPIMVQFIKILAITIVLSIAGRQLADFLTAQFPNYAELIENGVLVILAMPMWFFVIQPLLHMFEYVNDRKNRRSE